MDLTDNIQFIRSFERTAMLATTIMMTADRLDHEERDGIYEQLVCIFLFEEAYSPVI